MKKISEKKSIDQGSAWSSSWKHWVFGTDLQHQVTANTAKLLLVLNLTKDFQRPGRTSIVPRGDYTNIVNKLLLQFNLLIKSLQTWLTWHYLLWLHLLKEDSKIPFNSRSNINKENSVLFQVATHQYKKVLVLFC